MSDSDQTPPGPRSRPVVPPLCSRTLQHPSFMPLCMAADSLHHSHADSQTVYPIIPEEFFYTDPTMERGRRVPNIMSWLRVFDCSQLNAPPPIMSACPAPPIRPDPFGSVPVPTRDLGRLTWRMDGAHPPVRPGRLVLQLTPDEDQAVTNLLKLHHHREASQSEESPPDEETRAVFDSRSTFQATSAEEAHEAVRFDRVQQGGSWSCSELEAAHTLVSGFDPNERRLLHDPPLCQSTKTQHESDSSTESVNRDFNQTNNRCSTSSCVDEKENFWTTEDRSECCAAGFELKDRLISDTEGDAVHVLLSLADIEE